MRKIIIIHAMLALTCIPAFSQNIQDILFVQQLADRPTATCADAVRFFAYVTGSQLLDYGAAHRLLESRGVTAGMRLDPNALLRRGTLATMIARHLNLGDSLMYFITGTGRYATRACIAEGLMEGTASEWDALSGGELIDIATRSARAARGER